MGFLVFITRNLLGRPARTMLTVLGLGVGISAVILLIGVSWGFERSMSAIYSSRGIDIIVVRAGVSDQLSSNLDAGMIDQLRTVPDVVEVAPSLMDAVSFEEANLTSVLANGWEPGGLLIRNLRMIEGRPLEKGDTRAVMLGRVLALNLKKSVSDELVIAGEKFKVIGIFESDSLFESGGLIIPLAELQHMMGREGKVTGFVIITKPEVDPHTVGKAVEAKISGVAAIPSQNYVQNNVQIKLSRAMAGATIGVALMLGSIGLLNTMAMAVTERTGEIGLLRALGWKRKRIIVLLMGEAATLGILGVMVGALMSWIGMRGIMLSPTSRGFIDPKLPPSAFLVGLAMGIGLSVLGGLYPAIRASRLEPTEALRHD